MMRIFGGSLDELGVKYGTDKSSIHHDYLRKYERYLPFSRGERLRILEVGACFGGSLRTWGEYYPNSEVIGIDIDERSREVVGGNISIEIGSQVDGKFLGYIREKYVKFDMILDDASHRSVDQVFTFREMFSSVVSGGVYIVEDVCTSYWSEEFGGGSCVEYFKGLVDGVNFNGILARDPYYRYRRDDAILLAQERSEGREYIEMGIESILFMNSIIVVRKR